MIVQASSKSIQVWFLLSVVPYALCSMFNGDGRLGPVRKLACAVVEHESGFPARRFSRAIKGSPTRSRAAQVHSDGLRRRVTQTSLRAARCPIHHRAPLEVARTASRAKVLANVEWHIEETKRVPKHQNTVQL